MNLIMLIMQMIWNHSSNIIKNNQSINHMYTILNNQTPVINCDDLQTAIRFVQSLESGLTRHTDHSPYTIVRAADVPRHVPQADAHVHKHELYNTLDIHQSHHAKLTGNVVA